MDIWDPIIRELHAIQVELEQTHSPLLGRLEATVARLSTLVWAGEIPGFYTTLKTSDLLAVRDALCLHRSMILSGEDISSTSTGMFNHALNVLPSSRPVDSVVATATEFLEQNAERPIFPDFADVRPEVRERIEEQEKYLAAETPLPAGFSEAEANESFAAHERKAVMHPGVTLITSGYDPKAGPVHDPTLGPDAELAKELATEETSDAEAHEDEGWALVGKVVVTPDMTVGEAAEQVNSLIAQGQFKPETIDRVERLLEAEEVIAALAPEEGSRPAKRRKKHGT